MNKKHFALSLLLATFTTIYTEQNPTTIPTQEVKTPEIKKITLEQRIEALETQAKNMKSTSGSARSSFGSALRTTKIFVCGAAAALILEKIYEESEGLTKFPHFSTEDIENRGKEIITRIQTTYRNAREFNNQNEKESGKANATPKKYDNPFASNHDFGNPETSAKNVTSDEADDAIKNKQESNNETSAIDPFRFANKEFDRELVDHNDSPTTRHVYDRDFPSLNTPKEEATSQGGGDNERRD